MLRCFMIISLFFTSSKKKDNSSNRMGGSVRSTFQKVQRTDELEFLNASFMLSLHYLLCGFYKDYASEKNWYYMVLWFSVSFMLPQRRKRTRKIGWEVRFGQHFRRYKELMSLNFVCFFYTIIALSFMRFLQRFWFDKEVSKGVVLR